jgi:hypothetical protein
LISVSLRKKLPIFLSFIRVTSNGQTVLFFNRQLDELAKGLIAWLDSIPITGIPDLSERVKEVDQESKEGTPPEFAQALESGAAKKELKVSLEGRLCFEPAE